VDTAQAEIAQKRHGVADVKRRVAGAALEAFYRVLHARDVVQSSYKQAALSVELLRVAQERYQEGDIPLLHVKLTRAELTRAESKVGSAEQRYAEAQTVLAQVLGRSDTFDFQIQGDLSDRSLFDVAHQKARGVNRADLSEARAGIKHVQTKLALAELDRLPETSFSLGYKREEDADIVFAGFSVSLPVFNRGQGRRETLAAQLRSARIEEEAVRSVIESQIRGARLAYRSAVQAARGMQSEGVPLQIENSQLALEAYGAGKIDLASLLLIRRGSLDFQRETLDRQLAASLAGVQFALASGSLPIFESTVPTKGDSTLSGD
jgi:cobalt-zinc-cadmium efflux system outer membrane protein